MYSDGLDGRLIVEGEDSNELTNLVLRAAGWSVEPMRKPGFTTKTGGRLRELNNASTDEEKFAILAARFLKHGRAEPT